MWTSHLQTIDRQITKATLTGDSQAVSFREVIELWKDSENFRKHFTGLLAQSSFDAFFWETPPVTSQTLDRPFECVLVEGRVLSQLKADPSPFMSHFTGTSEGVVAFPNLGGDAILVVPAPSVDQSCYAHLARFLREAPSSQVDTFWRRVGLAMQERISSVPTWLSTAGLGVSWLHLRLDSRPKYYRYAPYKVLA